MSRRTLRTCPEPGCPRLLARGERCPEHGEQPFATSSYQQARRDGRRAEIPNSLRRRILERDSHRCVYCGAPATHVDHSVPRALGGTDHPSNLASACEPCHKQKTAQEANRIRNTPRIAHP